LRIHHWVKNILVFVPALANHSILNLVDFQNAVIAFFSFSFSASGIYLLNDIIDIDSDKLHPIKRFRPVASGAISKTQAKFISFLLIFLSGCISFSFDSELFFVLAIYVSLNLIYSTYLKSVPILDIIILAVMYELRIIAGGLSSDIKLSTWLLSSSGFFFVSMAASKRFSELSQSVRASTSVNAKRGYLKEDLDLLKILGIVSSFSSVLIFILYLNDPDTLTMYRSPTYLLFLAPILLLFLSKKWLEVSREASSEDPILNLLTDKNLLLIVPVVLLIIYVAI